MNKAYNKIVWQNSPSTATPLNQTNLNEMSNALDTIDDRVITLDSGKVGSVTVTNTLQTGDTIATITVDGTATNIKSAQITVDNAISPTSTNPVQNKAIYEMLNNLLPEGSESGNPISIDDASGLNAKACSVDLLPIQDLSHGDPSPTNICPISGRTEVNLFASGKNLGKYDLEYVTTTSVNLFSKSIFLPAGNYVASFGNITNANNWRWYIQVHDSAGNLLNDGTQITSPDVSHRTNQNGWINASNITSKTVRFTVVTPCYVGFGISYGDSSASSVVSNYQLEVGATATDYEPYQGETYTETLGQTVYGGKVDFVSEKLTIDKAYVDFGNLTWTAQGNPNTFQSLINDFATPSNDLFCSAYPVADYSISGGNMPDKSIKSYGNSSAKYIIVKDSSYSTTSEASTGLSGVQLCYPLATPIEVTLTAEQISLLKGNNVVSTDGDNINLIYSKKL